MSKTIRCLVHKHNYKHDTSFGNRLYYWSQSFLITARTKFEYNVVVQREFWPELIFLHLPNTLSKSIHSFLDVEDGGGRCSLISPNEAEEIIKHGFQSFQHENHWFLEPYTTPEVYSCILNDNPKCSPNLILSHLFDSAFKSIQFKHKEINDFFEDTFKDHVGIHIRRFYGVYLSEGDIEDVPEHLQKDYLSEYRPGDKSYPYVKDYDYFKIIDKILEHNPNQKFYLSTDLPFKYYQHYIQKYKNIFELSSYKEKLISILDKYYSKDLIEKTDYVISYLLDFFALSHSNLIIRPHKTTSWSKTAQKIKGTQSIILFRGKIARKYVENNNFKIIEEIFNVDS